MATIRVETVPVGEYQTNCYLVENAETGELFIVDAGAEAERIISAVGSRKPVAMFITHGHYDHIGAVDEVCAHFGIPLYMHEEDIPKLTDAVANSSREFDRDLTVHTHALPLIDGQTICLAGIEIAVLHTPGHSRGSCCYLLPESQGVLCGDTLFKGGYGRTDIGDGNFAELKKSLRRLFFDIPKQDAYPGHGSMTSAGQGERP